MLLVARLVYEKGFQIALEAHARADRALSGHTRFLVAGSGTHEEELRRQAADLGLMDHGTFLGWIGDDVLHISRSFFREECTAPQAGPFLYPLPLGKGRGNGP